MQLTIYLIFILVPVLEATGLGFPATHLEAFKFLRTSTEPQSSRLWSPHIYSFILHSTACRFSLDGGCSRGDHVLMWINWYTRCNDLYNVYLGGLSNVGFYSERPPSCLSFSSRTPLSRVFSPIETENPDFGCLAIQPASRRLSP